MNNFIYAVILFFFSLYATAAPTITAASVSKTGFVITGSNFGSANPMVFWDDASSNFSSSKMALNSIVPTGTGALWDENGSAYSTPFNFYKTQATRSHRDEVVYYGTGHSTHIGSPKLSGSVYDTLYVSWWYKPGKSPSDEGGSNKFIRIWDDKNGNGTRISWTQMHVTCQEVSLGSETQFVNWGTWNGNIGDWNHHEFYVNLTDKKIIAKVNGQVLHDTTCEKDPNQKGVPLYIGLLGFDHGSTAYQLQTTAIDDVYVGNSQARAVISNAATWSGNIITEVLPIKTWSSTKIETQVISGYLPLDKNLYLYVIDSAGNVNTNGYRVNCPQCPLMQ